MATRPGNNGWLIVWARAGDIAGALRTAPLKREFMKRSAFRGIAAAQAMAGDVRGALLLANSQRASLVKSYALLGVAEGILERIGYEVPQPVGPGRCWPIIF